MDERIPPVFYSRVAEFDFTLSEAYTIDARMLPTKFQVTRTLQSWDRQPPPLSAVIPASQP